MSELSRDEKLDELTRLVNDIRNLLIEQYGEDRLTEIMLQVIEDLRVEQDPETQKQLQGRLRRFLTGGIGSLTDIRFKDKAINQEFAERRSKLSRFLRENFPRQGNDYIETCIAYN